VRRFSERQQKGLISFWQNGQYYYSAYLWDISVIQNQSFWREQVVPSITAHFQYLNHQFHYQIYILAEQI